MVDEFGACSASISGDYMGGSGGELFVAKLKLGTQKLACTLDDHPED
jgi:hypothetical protein